MTVTGSLPQDGSKVKVTDRLIPCLDGQPQCYLRHVDENEEKRDEHNQERPELTADVGDLDPGYAGYQEDELAHWRRDQSDHHVDDRGYAEMHGVDAERDDRGHEHRHHDQ